MLLHKKISFVYSIKRRWEYVSKAFFLVDRIKKRVMKNAKAKRRKVKITNRGAVTIWYKPRMKDFSKNEMFCTEMLLMI